MKIKNNFIPMLLLFTLFASCKKNSLEPICNSTEKVTYDDDVKVIITSHCIKCHDDGSDDGVFNTYSAIKESLNTGTFEREVLIDQTMPRYDKLEQADLNILQCWLEGGYLEN